ncbi:MAG: hypothetical protein E6Q97_21385 [Desulfurellales bacterium]|nr:MAG: hypothetical protein E6Q97_21385 [Desulfurellales bacterium]
MAEKLPTPPDYTDAELLAHCKAAIAEVMVFNSSTFRGKTVTRTDLESLRKFKRELEIDIARESNGGLVLVNAQHARRT